jgi:3'-phosphoadenosine 5'-phosphosulfate sulfotransferase (PAPS reductase)/FAD synthetase
LVAAILAKKFLGLTDGVCDLSFCFVKQEKDIRQTARRLGFDVEWSKRLDYEWLAKRPNFVFPSKTSHVDAICQNRQRKTIAQFVKRRGFNTVITGRKRHGNTVKSEVYTTKGYVSCHPIAAWRDEHIWRFLKDEGINVPWVYSTILGKTEGNSAWLFYREHTTSLMRSWLDIYKTEPAIVKDAAIYGVRGAKEFLSWVRKDT